MTGGSPSDPNFYSVPKNHIPYLEEPLTKEGADKALKYLEEQTNKKIQLAPSDIEGTSFFQPTNKGGGLYNSPQESSQRTLFMSPTAGYSTLFHETGHARDPQLRSRMAKENQFNPNEIQALPSAAQRFQYLADKQINPRTQAEIEAQAYTGFQLPRFESANPALNIQSQKVFNDPWFKEYPASYIQKGIDKFYEVETGVPAQRFAIAEYESPLVGRNFEPPIAQNALRLALDKELQESQKNVIRKNLSEIEERLNPYQTNPTPFRSYLGQ